MLNINTLLVSILFFFPLVKERWVVSENSSLMVNGSTNINKFSCEIPEYGETDTLTVTKSGKGITLSGNIGLNIQSFDCHNTMMTRDLRKTLKGQQYPRLNIQFLSLSEIPESSSKTQPITGQVNIQLAGATKRFEINYQISTGTDKVIHLLGSKEINFSDFSLVPPRKLGGMIKTNDQLTVTFHLKIKTI